MNKIKRFLGTTMVYFVGTVLSKLVSFFLLPIYTNKILPTEYGNYDLILTILNLIAPIAFFQIWDGMFRRSFDFEEADGKYSVIANAHIVSLFGAIVYMIAFGAVQIFCDFENFVWAAIYGFFFSLHYLYGFICRVFLKNKLLVATGFVNTIVTAVLNIVLIVVFDMGVVSLYIAPSVGTLLQIIIVEIRLKTLRHIRIDVIDRSEIMRMLRFSIPLCVSSLSYWLLSGFTKVDITAMLGAYENGLYAVANKFGTLITLIVSIVQSAWNEMAYLMVGEKDRAQGYRICTDIMVKSLVFGTAGLLVIIKWIYPILIDAQYEEGFWIVPATVIGVMFNSVAGFLGTFFMAENDTKTIMKSTLIAAALNIILCISMTYFLGLQGAICSLAIAFFALCCLRLYQSSKCYGISIGMRALLILFFVLTASVLEYYLIDSMVLDAIFIVLIIGLFVWSMRTYLKSAIHIMKSKRNG